MGGDQHANRRGLQAAHLSEQLQTGHAGHLLVGQHNRHLVVLNEVEGPSGTGDRVRVERGLEHLLEHVTDRRVIIDDEHKGA
jgi:hypothetical protein